MFLTSKLSWNVVVPAKNLDVEGVMLQKAILIQLLDEFAAKKASKDIGYFLAVKNLDYISEGIIRQHSGDLLFRVDFTCITFKMLPGEVLEGVVHKIMKHGVFVRCGPADKVYISHRTMDDYHYVPGENPFFGNEDSPKIEKGTVVRFLVLDEKYDEAEKDFRAVVSLKGDHLGPVS